MNGERFNEPRVEGGWQGEAKGTLLKDGHDTQVVVLLDANLSALDLYARRLSDLVIANVTESLVAPAPATFLVLSESLGGLPVPLAFQRVSVCIDLDRVYEFRAEDTFGSTALDLSETSAPVSKLWNVARRRLEAEVGKLAPEDQALALSVLLSEEGS